MINLRIANENDKELYRNMFNMYQHELSSYSMEFSEVDENGYFDKDTIEVYFSGTESLLPYVITANDKTAGCVVLSKPSFV